MTQSTTPPLALLPSVIEAVEEAGRALRTEFHRPGGPRGRGEHAEIDMEIEVLLKTRLLALRPCGWLGEETGTLASTDPGRWVVDPHDGTRDFLNGLRGSSISVALLEWGRPVLGVVFAPTAPDDDGDLIAWAEGGSLTRNGQPAEARSSWDTPVVALNADAGDYADDNHRALPGFRIRALPSPAYRLALAAVGEVDAALSLTSGLASWDIAGGHALLFGAGKHLTDRHGEPIIYRGRNSFDGCIGGDRRMIDALVFAKLRKGSRNTRRAIHPVKRIADAGRLSRAQGALLGQLAGDALGSAVEFEDSTSIARRHPKGVRLLSDGGTWNLIAGQPTDDSEMALALARSLVVEGGFTPIAVSSAYVRWHGSRPFDIGSTTSSGIAALSAGGIASSDSQANGALMRVSPIGIFAAGRPHEAGLFARLDARLTHPSDICQSASAAYAAAIAAGIAGGDADAMWQAAYENVGPEAAGLVLQDRLEKSRLMPPSDYQHQMGWVLTAFQNSFYWLMKGADLETAVVSTVSAGGDTDTNGAICGALLGACQGRDAVPLQWRNAILTCRPVEAPDVQHPRPIVFWPDDALELAEALLAAHH